MKTQYFTIHTDRYNIACKNMMPDRGEIQGMILGVHGFCGDKESSAIEAVAKEMTQHNYGLICFDFPAHGKSEATDEQLTIANCKRDLLIVIDYLQEKFPKARKGIFATSFGGYIALLCEEALNDYQIILRSPAVTMPEHILVDIIDIPLEEYESTGYTVCGFERKIKLPYAFYEALQQNSIINNNFDREMTIIHGDLDTVVPRADILSFCEKNPKAKLISIDGADHRYKNPGELEKIVRIAKMMFLNH